MILIGSELLSDDSQSQISIDQFESDGEEACTDHRNQELEAGSILELNTSTILQYLRPFKAQLADLSHLTEFVELAPYIAIPISKRSGDTDTSPDGSTINGDEDGTPPPGKRCRIELATKVQYPPTPAQSRVLEQFRQAHTLVFPSLPSADWVIKLIALSLQISEPFYNQVLFPNVKRVIYSSAMQEKSLVERSAFLGSNPSPHPITFALSWLVYDFSLCIHSVTSAFRAQWINTHMRSDESDTQGDDLLEKYVTKWTTLNPLAGTISIDKHPRLQSISYHNILPGDRPITSDHLETYLYFGRHEESVKLIDITLRAISKPLSRVEDEPDISFRLRLHLIDVEYLAVPASKKYGSKAGKQRSIDREEALKRLFRHIFTVCKKEGRKLDGAVASKILATLTAGNNKYLTDGLCYTCTDECQEFSCSKSTFSYRAS